jgi:hypothetical protein
MRALGLQSRELRKTPSHRRRCALGWRNRIGELYFADFEIRLEDKFRVTYPI